MLIFIHLCSIDSNFFNITNAPASVNETDIFISVFIRTYGNGSTLAVAHFCGYNPETYRPMQGAIYVNPRFIPGEIQRKNSTNTYFFITLTHEIFHALGISGNSFELYHPKGSNKVYEKPLVNLYDEETGKNHTFLVTP